MCSTSRLAPAQRRDAHIPVNSLPESSPAVPHGVGSGPGPSRRFGACSVSDSTDLFWLIYCRVGGGGGFVKRFYKRLLWRSVFWSALGCVVFCSVCLRVEYLWLMPSCRIANIDLVDTTSIHYFTFRLNIVAAWNHTTLMCLVNIIFDSRTKHWKYLEEQTNYNNYVNCTKLCLIRDIYFKTPKLKTSKHDTLVRSNAGKMPYDWV